MCLIYQELVNASGRSTGQSYQVSVVPFTAQSWIERSVSGKSWCNSSLFSKATLIYIGLRSSGTHSSIPTAQNWNKGNKQTVKSHLSLSKQDRSITIAVGMALCMLHFGQQGNPKQILSSADDFGPLQRHKFIWCSLESMYLTRC